MFVDLRDPTLKGSYALYPHPFFNYHRKKKPLRNNVETYLYIQNIHLKKDREIPIPQKRNKRGLPFIFYCYINFKTLPLGCQE